MALHRTVFFWLLALIPIQLGYHWWPDWSYILGRRIDYLSPTLYGTDLVIVLLLLLWGIDVLFRKGPASRNGLPVFRAISFPAIVYAALFLVIAGLNIHAALRPEVAIYKWVKIMEFALLGIYVISSKARWQDAVAPLSIGVLYTSCIAVLQFVVQRSVGGPLWALGERTFALDTPGIARFDFCPPPLFYRNACTLMLRAYGTFPHPNVLGGFLAALLPLISYRIIEMVGRLRKPAEKRRLLPLFIASAVFGFVGLIVTFSRTAWVAAGIGLVGAYVLLYRRSLLQGTGIQRGILVLLCAMLLGTAYYFRPIVSDAAVTQRLDLADAAATMWKDSPLFGVGLGNFLVRLPEYTVTRTASFLQPAHSIYWMLLAEGGVLGVLLMAVGILGLFPHKIRGIPPIAISALLILIIGFVDHYPVTLQQGQLLLTLVGSLAIVSFAKP